MFQSRFFKARHWEARYWAITGGDELPVAPPVRARAQGGVRPSDFGGVRVRRAGQR